MLSATTAFQDRSDIRFISIEEQAPEMEGRERNLSLMRENLFLTVFRDSREYKDIFV